MAQSENNFRIDYIEFPATDIEATKRFYHQVFGWDFQDYGPGYTSFHDGRLAGGFNSEAQPARAGAGKSTRGPLVVLYASSLPETKQKVIDAGGKIVRDIFEFPGGQRFHFSDPNGNELAVWSE
jgi:predicted enzyme related to lactoylglutathione lyase